ncbi:MAG TPA: LuxR C-terminal-related transcriptional regulator [Streptosporangiaceae bacterium]|jgi:LuxR family maltose regulon positive regulatory protein
MSKITAPSLPGWAIARPRLDYLLGAGANGPLTVVTGPPGAGKSMSIALWAAARPDAGTVAWITLDEYDNRPQVFWSYFVAALRQASIAVPGTGALAGREKVVSHEFLLRLASALASAPQPVLMVIEDFHLLTDTDVLDGLSYLLRNAAPSLRLVISSRTQLPLSLSLHRYRLNGELTEIRAADLAFDSAESALLMAQHDVTLSAGALADLISRTEGWAAGIRLTAMSLDGHPDPEQFVKELCAEDSAITGYLVEEVLNPQSDALRGFLLRTSILDRVRADLAGELCDLGPFEASQLSTLAEANAFVQPLGGGWYRYHPLLAEMLRLKLRHDFPRKVADLHRRAARWCLRNGYLTEAVRHAADANDWPLAARMVVEDYAVSCLAEPQDHQSMAIAGMFHCMPEDAAAGHWEPLLVMAALGLSGDADGIGSASLSRVEEILDHLPAEDEIPARLAAALLRMTWSRQVGDLDAGIAASVQADRMLSKISGSVLASHPEIRPQVLLARGVVEFWTGNADQAAATFRIGIAAASAPASCRERADCVGQLSLVEALQGRLSSAALLAGETAGTASHRDQPLEPALPAASAALACVHLTRCELRQAHDQLVAASAALRTHPDKLTSAVASLIAAATCLAEGRADAALKLISRARQRWQPPRWLEHKLTLLESQACAAAGALPGAVDAAARAESQAASGAAVDLAYAWLAAGDEPAARRVLATAGFRGDQKPLDLTGSLIDARLSYGSGDSARGHRSLERALQLAEAEQIRLPFARERVWLRPILRRDPDLVRRYGHLLEGDLRSIAAAPATLPGSDEPPPLMGGPLSDREREVLQRLSGMLSTAEIATDMYISVNTVKTHLKSIYRKLSATHRGEAVRRARKLNLI